VKESRSTRHNFSAFWRARNRQQSEKAKTPGVNPAFAKSSAFFDGGGHEAMNDAKYNHIS
jgi:hypothetical protein